MRTQIDFSQEETELLLKLMRETGSRTKKDLFRSAISLLLWAVKERKEGRIILSKDERNNREKELVMPALEIKKIEKRKEEVGDR